MRHAGVLALALVIAFSADAGAASSWSIASSPNPGSTQQSFLDGVSCATSATSSAPTCFAVGSIVTPTGNVQALIERWNGTSWSDSPSPQKKSTLLSALVAVACPKPNSCVAVGNSRATAKSATLPLIEQWNGSGWAVVASHGPKGATGNYLNSVSCAAGTCYAVGSYTSPYTVSSTLVERSIGGKWSIVKSPNPPGAVSSSLAGMSCTGVANATCWAVGTFSNKVGGDPFFTLTERMRGGKWSLIGSPNAGGSHSSNLNAVSCTSATNCNAVGEWQHNLGATLIEHWNGTRWSIVPSANPPGYTLSQLAGVSCSSAQSCVAAGTFASGSPSGSTLIEQWNGAHWTVESSPNPAGASSALAGVSCMSATRCFTVGTYLQSSFANPAAGFSEDRS